MLEVSCWDAQMGMACAELQKQHTEMERSLEIFCKEQAAALQELCMVRCLYTYIMEWPRSGHCGRGVEAFSSIQSDHRLRQLE